ncbi:type 2 DNA topoisomerase 6 subunit B-like isoform X2 [Mus musculus]|uniref:type 2 DNA topoisomerase 6 subunit B-like isoform X2 n=1 Tax=Mus musculus TaxID=10090 RepID=UPI0005ABA2E1|nr:type 2 DNA topoisomerase 6 subunit B-like isoform X2 [Mus musculus]|eukprot:XP_011246937.1 PREDICTED: type 2 DNA topoisomerase 6 subunit B-like isoform X2 [Mus musculus]
MWEVEPGPRHRPQNRRQSHLGSRASLGILHYAAAAFQGAALENAEGGQSALKRAEGRVLARPWESLRSSRRPASSRLASNLGRCATCPPAHPPTDAGRLGQLPQCAGARAGGGADARSGGKGLPGVGALRVEALAEEEAVTNWQSQSCSRSPYRMERTALAVCEILRYLIIHWKCEAGTAKGTLLDGQLVISIEALRSKHLPDSLHCIITIASTRSVYGGLNFKKFLQEIQPALPRLSAKLALASEEGGRSQDASGIAPCQVTFEVDENSQSLMTDCLVIKHFLRKIIIVHHKLKFSFSVAVNGTLSAETFGRAENEPTLRLDNGVTLVVGFQRYVSKPKLNWSEAHCSRIHPVLGHPAPLFIPDAKADTGLLGELTLTPAAALCPSPKGFSSQLCRISSVSIFLYGPLGLPLLSSDQDQPSTAVFRDTSYFIDWKKYNLFMVPNLDLNLDTQSVLPDVNYKAESPEGNQSQNMNAQGPALLLFLFVDFQSDVPVQQAKIWGLHTLLTAHLSAILSESRSTVQQSIQSAVDQVWQLYHHDAKTQQRLQASLSVAVNSIMSVLTGSTRSSFRKTCLQALEAADTQEFGVKLHRIFYDITQHQFLKHCSCDTEQHLTPEKNISAQNTKDQHKNIAQEFPEESIGQAENKRPKRGSPNHGREESRVLGSARDRSPPKSATRDRELTEVSLTARGSQTQAAHGRAQAAEAASPAGGLEDLWLQEVSNLSEWLNPGHRS